MGDGTEQQTGASATIAETTPVDRWNLYFNRGVQLVGLAIIIKEQQFGDGDLGTYLVASSMMLGSEGLRRLVRGIAGSK